MQTNYHGPSVPQPNLFEAHVTIEPVFGDSFDYFEMICRQYKFKPAELLLMKTRAVTPERSNKDSFCTGHGSVYHELLARTQGLVECLRGNGFAVWRHKIEGILYDVRETRLFNIQEKKAA